MLKRELQGLVDSLTQDLIKAEAELSKAQRELAYNRATTRPQAPEAPEEWETELGVMLRGMTFPDQIISYVKSLLKAERERVLGEIEGVMVIDGESAWEFESRVIGKIAEIRGD